MIAGVSVIVVIVGVLGGGYLYATYGVHIAYSLAAVAVLAGSAMLLPIPYHVFLIPHSARQRRHLASTRAAAGRPPLIPR